MKKLILIVLGIFLVSSVYAVGQISYCCEKTNAGAWCQNAIQSDCDTGNNCEGNACKSTPSSCQATSYCRLGCCYDSQQGSCMKNTPQQVCTSNGGIWDASADCSIPQCELGCCLIGDQAAFVTQTQCKALSSLYGLQTNFRTDLTNEVSCISSASPGVKGACVYEEDFARTCQFLTKQECTALAKPNSTFHKDKLCSDDTLGTNCGPSQKTTCVHGRDEVYFLDTCGNLANIYDSSKINDKTYWSTIVAKTQSCNPTVSNANSVSCGNCDYYLGSTCKKYKKASNKPTYGDNICEDLGCKYDGKDYQHGETWCADSKGSDKNLPGSRHFRLVCYNGDVTVEPCADFRAEVCHESEIDGFKTAACRVNMWQDCNAQINKKDCNNTAKRDCQWVGGKCVPLYAPGFDFWVSDGSASELCDIVSSSCVVKYEKKLTGGKKCVENCECLLDSWKTNKNKECVGIGDCGSKTNYLGFQGYN